MVMARYLRAILLLAALGPIMALTSPARAQTADPKADAPPPKPKRYHSVSPELAASLAATMPKYNPPKPVEKKPDDEDVDLRDVDKPKNQIIRLPKYVVQEQKPPVFRERDIHTAKGLAALAIKRYLSEADRALNSFRLPFFGVSNEARALAMYAEDERLKNISDLNDTARTVGKTDPKEAAYIKRATQDTYMRWSDFGWNGGSSK
jgi:hypothetical protein